MALSHCEALDSLAMKGTGRAILISKEVTVVVGWVDMGFWVTGFTGDTEAGGITTIGFTGTGTWGRGVLVDWEMTAASRELLGLGSGLMSSGFQLS